MALVGSFTFSDRISAQALVGRPPPPPASATAPGPLLAGASPFEGLSRTALMQC